MAKQKKNKPVISEEQIKKGESILNDLFDDEKNAKQSDFKQKYLAEEAVHKQNPFL